MHGDSDWIIAQTAEQFDGVPAGFPAWLSVLTFVVTVGIIWFVLQDLKGKIGKRR